MIAWLSKLNEIGTLILLPICSDITFSRDQTISEILCLPYVRNREPFCCGVLLAEEFIPFLFNQICLVLYPRVSKWTSSALCWNVRETNISAEVEIEVSTHYS